MCSVSAHAYLAFLLHFFLVIKIVSEGHVLGLTNASATILTTDLNRLNSVFIRGADSFVLLNSFGVGTENIMLLREMNTLGEIIDDWLTAHRVNEKGIPAFA